MKCLAVFVVAFLTNLIDFSDCWVFTDVNYGKLARSIENNELDGLELTDEELKQLKFNLIYPGTKWCGAGNVADSFDDLGSSWETDKCCRAHDHCPDVIPAGETRNNLTNDAFYSRLSCKCDEDFQKCLHEVDTKTSNQIGTIYFNALAQKCYKKDYPIQSCKRRGGWLNRKCLEYELDKDGQEVYQWFYVPNY